MQIPRRGEKEFGTRFGILRARNPKRTKSCNRRQVRSSALPQLIRYNGSFYCSSMQWDGSPLPRITLQLLMADESLLRRRDDGEQVTNYSPSQATGGIVNEPSSQIVLIPDDEAQF